MTGALPHPGSPGAFLLAARPRTLLVGAAPVLLGAAAAWHATGRLDGAAAAAALAGALLLQLGSNYANDLQDFLSGADNPSRVGPPRAAQLGLLTPGQLKAAVAGSFALATFAGLYLTAVAGWVVLAIGAISILAALAYTGGPFPLGYHGLGEVTVFLFFGPVAAVGTAFVATGALPPLAWLASVPAGALGAAVLVVNNLRDRGSDAAAGKRTVVVRFGRRFGVGLYATLLALAYAAPLTALALGQVGGPALLPLLTLPLALRLARAISREEGAALLPRLGQTAALLFLFSLLFALGMALS